MWSLAASRQTMCPRLSVRRRRTSDQPRCVGRGASGGARRTAVSVGGGNRCRRERGTTAPPAALEQEKTIRFLHSEPCGWAMGGYNVFS